jgi:hypothetical protein
MVKAFLLTAIFGPVSGLSHLSAVGSRSAVSRENRPEREDYYSLPYCAEIKNEWI